MIERKKWGEAVGGRMIKNTTYKVTPNLVFIRRERVCVGCRETRAWSVRSMQSWAFSGKYAGSEVARNYKQVATPSSRKRSQVKEAAL